MYSAGQIAIEFGKISKVTEKPAIKLHIPLGKIPLYTLDTISEGLLSSTDWPPGVTVKPTIEDGEAFLVFTSSCGIDLDGNFRDALEIIRANRALIRDLITKQPSSEWDSKGYSR